MRALLAEAELAGRALVIASDHGHVLDHNAVMRRGANADRFRLADAGPVESDEVLIAGNRVLEPGRRTVALAGEGIRYTAVFQC